MFAARVMLLSASLMFGAVFADIHNKTYAQIPDHLWDALMCFWVYKLLREKQ